MLAGLVALKPAVEGELAAIMAPQVDDRVEAARHGDEIASDAAFIDDTALSLAP